MKYLLCVIATLFAAVSVQAGELGKDKVCASWARNATIGGQHALMGHKRRLVPLALEHIIELIEHRELLKIDGIPVFVEEHAVPEGRAFLEDSVFYGFDYVLRTSADQLPGSAAQMLEVFSELCHSGDRLVSR